MSDCMTFPDTVEEFMEQYKITDTDHVYSNGTEFVPIFRMKQWFEHLPSAQPEHATCYLDSPCEYQNKNIALPSAQPERKTGKWRNAYADYEGFGVYCSCCNEITVYPYNYCPNCGAKMEENDGN